jgi:hypothetical protein
MYGSRVSSEFIKGLQDFLRVADANKRNGFVVCPCSVCKNLKNYSSSRTLHVHLLQHGFMPSYNCWTKHGERGVTMEDNKEEDDDNYPGFPEYGDTFMGEAEGGAEGETHDEAPDDLGRTIADARSECETNKERKKLDRMLEDHKKFLYPNCQNGLKKLGSTLELLKWKSEEGLSDSGFEKLLKIMRNMLPKDNELPTSMYEAKKNVYPLGLEVQKIHACPNDCNLYHGDYEDFFCCDATLVQKICSDISGEVSDKITPPGKICYDALIV